MQSISVVQMLKSPASSQVKTRLSPVLSLEERQLLHWQMVERMATAIGQFAQSNLYNGALAVAGELDNTQLSELSSRLGLPLILQEGKDLGERMWNALNQALEQSDGAIVVGSDCPFIGVEYLQQAADALKTHDVVLGPATDGGYVLLGIRKPVPVFTGIDWGTEHVLKQTINRLEESGTNYVLLPELNDIDLPEDLRLLNDASLPKHFSSWESSVDKFT